MSRPAGCVLLACAAIVLVLFLLHPGGQAPDFARLVQMEAAQRAQDALVHGGFVLLLPLIVAGQAQLARRLGLERFANLAALALFTAGSILLAGSLLVDGLMIPDMAAHLLAGPPQRIEAARPAFLLASSVVRILMPSGLLLQALGGAGLALGALRLKRWIAAAGLAVTLLTAAGIALTLGAQPMVLMAAVALMAVVWTALSGVLLLAA